jgi:FkbM family methyltransferase
LADVARISLAWTHPPRLAVAAVIALGGLIGLWLNLPGHFSYDSVVQLAEGRAGVYSGEHPPVMSWLLGLADALTPGAGLFVVVDTLLIDGALIAFVLLAPRASWLAVPLAAALLALPQLALYPAIVWKDVLFAGASVAGFAALAWAAAWWSEPRRRYALVGVALVLLTLAALSRQNGAVVLPIASLAFGAIAASLARRPSAWRGVTRGLAFLVAGAALFVAASTALATRLEQPDANSEAWAALQTYDVVGAAAREPALALSVLKARDPALLTLIRTTGVAEFSPARVDSLQPVLDRMDPNGADDAPLAAQWRSLIARHPLLYLRGRASAFRWVFLTPDPDGCLMVYTGVSGPDEEMTGAHLRPRKSAVDDELEDYATAFTTTPAFSHAAYAAVGLALLLALLRRRRAPDIAVAAMVGAALAFTASFAVISFACDYRYLYDLDIAVIAAALYMAADARWGDFSLPAFAIPQRLRQKDRHARADRTAPITAMKQSRRKNLALRKPATQSSTSEWSTHPHPSKDARAGNNGRTKSRKFLHTKSENRPWWQVDLGNNYLVDSVRIYNRDAFQWRLSRFSILRSTDGKTWNVAYTKMNGDVFDQIEVEIPGECLARYLRLRLDGVSCLHFQECEVFGRPADPETVRRLLKREVDLRVQIPEGRRGHITELGGFLVFVDEVQYGDKIGASIDEGYYELRERGLAGKYIKPGDRVLEVGTAIGVVTMSAARIVGAQNVSTFDANPDIVADAKANFVRNGLAEINAQVGVLKNRNFYRPGDHAKFYVAEAFWASRLNGSPSAKGYVKTVDVPVFCLEDELQRTNANVMIVDIEGGEADLLSQADLSQIRLIIMETHYWSVGERKIDAMVASLTAAGFAMDLMASRDQVIVLRKHESTPLSTLGVDPMADVPDLDRQKESGPTPSPKATSLEIFEKVFTPGRRYEQDSEADFLRDLGRVFAAAGQLAEAECRWKAATHKRPGGTYIRELLKEVRAAQGKEDVVGGDGLARWQGR